MFTLLLSSFSTIFFGEVLLRISTAFENHNYINIIKQLKSKESHTNIFDADEQRYFKLKPNSFGTSITSEYTVSYKINEIGFRDDSIRPEQPYYLALGESFTFGEGLNKNESYVDILENKLEINILNMGSPGQGIGQVANSLKDNIKKVPHIKGCFLFYLRTLYSRIHTDREQKNYKDNPETIIIKNKNDFLTHDIFLNERSQLISFIKYLAIKNKIKNILRDKDISKWHIHSQDFYASKYHKLKSLSQNLIQRGVLYISSIRDLCKNSDAKLYVINIDAINSFDFINEIEGITYINLMPQIRDHAVQHSLSFNYDRHYNSETNQFIANVLSHILEL